MCVVCREINQSVTYSIASFPGSTQLFNVAREKRGRGYLFHGLRHETPTPDIVIAVIDKQSSHYCEIKKVGDATGGVGIATQCVLSETVQRKCNPATLANICLKMNAKLGGVNSIIDQSSRPPTMQREPVIIFGADVTHPKAGDKTTPSIASVVASMDFTASKFQARHHDQKHWQEVITQLKDMVVELLRDFYKENKNCKPRRIIFYRDGVSEGQFDQIRLHEVAAIQQACLTLQKDGSYRPGITFIVVQKCHHTRLFPTRHEDAIGKGNNVPPGTTVDHEITHPTEFDFYLCSHAAIQVPADPVTTMSFGMTMTSLLMIFNFSPTNSATHFGDVIAASPILHQPTTRIVMLPMPGHFIRHKGISKAVILPVSPVQLSQYAKLRLTEL